MFAGEAAPVHDELLKSHPTHERPEVVYAAASEGAEASSSGRL